jgi:hypothetical protein
MSVQLHYPEVFDDSSGNIPYDLGDQAENFSDFEQGLDWNFDMARHEGKRQTTEGLIQFG